MKKYEVWQSRAENGATTGFVEAGQIEKQVQQGLWEGRLTLLGKFEASDYNDACQKYNDIMGWGKYHPMTD